MSYKIVVARYNESVSWLESEHATCVIYNKGHRLSANNEILLPNVGRESETYLHYIIDHYNNLPEVVVFTQAMISDHKGSDDVNYLLNIKNEALQFSCSQNYFKHYDEGGKCIHFDKEWNFRSDGIFLKDNYKINTPIPFLSWFTTHIQATYPDPILVYGNGIFAVKRELILKNPIDYYKTLIAEVDHHIDSTEGHFFERSWYYIFNK